MLLKLSNYAENCPWCWIISITFKADYALEIVQVSVIVEVADMALPPGGEHTFESSEEVCIVSPEVGLPCSQRAGPTSKVTPHKQRDHSPRWLLCRTAASEAAFIAYLLQTLLLQNNVRILFFAVSPLACWSLMIICIPRYVRLLLKVDVIWKWHEQSLWLSSARLSSSISHFVTQSVCRSVCFGADRDNAYICDW